MMRLRIVSWNIHSCVGTDRRYDPQRIARVLATLDADVIGLQEVDWRKPNIDGLDQLEYLAEALGMAAVKGPILEDHRGLYGNGLLTRLDIDEVQETEIAEPGYEPRGLIDARLSAADYRVRTLVTHLGLSRSERRRQFEKITASIAAAPPAPDERMVLLGDMNEWRSIPLRNLHGLQRWFSAEVAPRTFPAQVPMFRLDRVLAGVPIALPPITLSKQERMASDHRPVCVEIELKSGA